MLSLVLGSLGCSRGFRGGRSGSFLSHVNLGSRSLLLSVGGFSSRGGSCGGSDGGFLGGRAVGGITLLLSGLSLRRNLGGRSRSFFFGLRAQAEGRSTGGLLGLTSGLIIRRQVRYNVSCVHGVIIASIGSGDSSSHGLRGSALGCLFLSFYARHSVHLRLARCSSAWGSIHHHLGCLGGALLDCTVRSVGSGIGGFAGGSGDGCGSLLLGYRCGGVNATVCSIRSGGLGVVCLAVCAAHGFSSEGGENCARNSGHKGIHPQTRTVSLISLRTARKHAQ